MKRSLITVPMLALAVAAVAITGGRPAAASGTWTKGVAMTESRSDHSATLLPDGRLLVVGGTVTAGSNTAEIYDPATQEWSLTGS